MTTTNIQSISTALYTLVKSLTPTGTAYGRSSYRQANPDHEWGTRADSDIDREFTFDEISFGDDLSFGVHNESIMRADLIMRIGHFKMANLLEAGERRDTDIEQIKTAMQDKDNFPAQVCLIRLRGRGRVDNPEHWITELRFELQYKGAI